MSSTSAATNRALRCGGMHQFSHRLISFFSVFLTVSSEMRSTISTGRPASSVHSPRAGTRPASPPSPPFRPTVHLLLAAEGGPLQDAALAQAFDRRRADALAQCRHRQAPLSIRTCAPGARSDPGAPAPKGLSGRASCPESWPRSCHCPEDLRACPLSGPAHGAACLFGICPCGYRHCPDSNERRHGNTAHQKPSIQCRWTTRASGPRSRRGRFWS